MRTSFTDIAHAADPEMSAQWLEYWFAAARGTDGGRGAAELFLLPSARSTVMGVDDLIDTVRASGVEDLRGEDGVYFAVTTVDPVAGEGVFTKRTGRRLVAGGAWMDLDVKPGAAGTAWAGEDEILGAVQELGATAAVLTGSGGVHAYWAVEGGVSAEVGAAWSRRLRELVRERWGVVVDNVAQEKRVMRLPGTVRGAGKRHETAPGRLVRTAWLRPALTREQAGASWDSCARAWDAVEREARRVRDAVLADRIEAEEFLAARRGAGLANGRGGAWSDLLTMASVDAIVSAETSWDRILRPLGWTLAGGGEPDAEGRRVWTRPGGGEKNPRSAVTDWVGSPDVMSLLSDAEETGLARLKRLMDSGVAARAGRSGIALTKSVVMAELYFEGRMADFVQAYLFAGWRPDGGPAQR